MIPANPTATVVWDRVALATRVGELGERIHADHPDGVVLVGVLKGALIFLADLVRAVPAGAEAIDVTVDFLAISRYAPDSGRVRILQDLEVDVTGRDVVIVEDLVDTGLTLAYVLEHVRRRGARRVEVCTLLDRPERRIVPIPIRYVGTEIPGDAFAIGYGLHFGDRYRNLPEVVITTRDTLDADPDAHLGCYRDGPGGASNPR